MNWKIGQKLVCVDDNLFATHPVVKGEIYTYDGVWPRDPNYIFVSEITGMTMTRYGHDRQGFNPIIFRPIVSIGDEVEEYIKSKINEPELV